MKYKEVQATKEVIESLDDNEYYFIKTTGGQKRTHVGYQIKTKRYKIIDTILIPIKQ